MNPLGLVCSVAAFSLFVFVPVSSVRVCKAASTSMDSSSSAAASTSSSPSASSLTSASVLTSGSASNSEPSAQASTASSTTSTPTAATSASGASEPSTSSETTPTDSETFRDHSESNQPFFDPEHVFLSFRLGAYEPQVDKGQSGSPYRTVMGDSFRMNVGIEAGWWPRLGDVASLGFTVLGTFFRATEKEIVQTDPEIVRGNEELTFEMTTLSAVLSLRLDYLVTSTPVPLAPYGKVGVTVAQWWASEKVGLVKNGAAAIQGDSPGFMAALGLALELTPLDPGAGRQIRRHHGVVHSYLFAEWTYYQLDGFGKATALNIGDSRWTTGFAFDF